MKAAKLTATIVLTTILAAMLSCLAMLLTTMNWAEPLDLGMATAMWSWVALFHLVAFMLPLTFALEPNASGMRWLYYAVASGAALVWTIMLDGPEQLLSYIFAVAIGCACARCWTWLLGRLNPWKQHNA